jgi:voltage-gated potassium channel
MPDPDDRATTLAHLERWLERPMLVLAVAWLGLLIAELVMELPAALEHATTGIWAVFVADFGVRLWLATDRLAYVKRNWLTLIALVIPALRLFRFTRVVGLLRVGRAARGIRAARLVTGFNRARRTVHAALARRHALGYVVALTLSATFIGAAGMLAFEREQQMFDGYGHALWWTAMLLTTMGSEHWPVTLEGRILCLALAIYGFAIFGYIAGTIASWFVGKDRVTRDQAATQRASG